MVAHTLDESSLYDFVEICISHLIGLMASTEEDVCPSTLSSCVASGCAKIVSVDRPHNPLIQLAFLGA
jgi:hypothetical protein